MHLSLRYSDYITAVYVNI